MYVSLLKTLFWMYVSLLKTLFWMYVSFEHTISIGFYELFGCDLYVSFKITFETIVGSINFIEDSLMNERKSNSSHGSWTPIHD